MLSLGSRRLMSAKPSVKTSVILYYDIVSPYTYLQFELLNRQNHWHSMDLSYKPVLIGKLLQSSNNKPPMLCPAKGIHLFNDLSRLAEFHKVELVYCLLPMTAHILIFVQISFHLPLNKFSKFAMEMKNLPVQLFHTALHDSLTVGDQEKLIRANFKELFSTNGRDLAKLETIRQVALETGIEQGLVDKGIDAIEKPETTKKLEDNTQHLTEIGAFGLPVTEMHLPKGSEFVWGSDRLHIIGHLLGESEPPILQ